MPIDDLLLRDQRRSQSLLCLGGLGFAYAKWRTQLDHTLPDELLEIRRVLRADNTAGI